MSTCSPILNPQRLAALRRAALLDTPPEESFDRITRLASRYIGAPVSLVSLVDRDRQYFKSCQGLPDPYAQLRQTPLTHSFCQHVVTTSRPLLIEDARTDPRVKDNLAIADLGVIAYAGQPLVTADGYTLGSFCVIDHKPRHWTREEIALLEDLATIIVGEIELRAARRHAEGQTLDERRLRMAVLDSTSDGIYGTDEEGRCTFVNSAAAAMLGWLPADLLGRPMHATMHHTRADGTAYPVESCPVERAIRSGSGCSAVEELLWRKDGSSFTAELSASPIMDGVRQSGAVVIFRDITLRKVAEDQLRRAKEEAEHASKAKDRFMAVLSHELRTPLTPVLMASAVMEGDASLPEEVRADAAMIHRNIAIEARMVDDLLDLTAIAHGRLSIRSDQVRLHGLLEQCVGELAEALRAAGLTVRLRLEAAEHTVTGDAGRLMQVFRNVLGNAVKFTPAGGSVEVETANPAADRVVVRITDTGVGIEAGMLERIFDPLEISDSRVTEHFDGLGMGLSLSRALVRLHGGSMEAASPGKGQGATFTMDLPLAGKGAAGGEGGRSGLEILLVEDHEPTARVQKRLLEKSGHRVTLAGTVAAAREALAGGRFDILLSDIGLPDGLGWDLMREVKGEIPGVAISGYGTDNDIARSRRAGFATHLVKPVDASELVQALLAAHTAFVRTQRGEAI